MAVYFVYCFRDYSRDLFLVFISRCGNEECFLNYDPLPEMFIGGVIGAFLYVIIWGMTSDM